MEQKKQQYIIDEQSLEKAKALFETSDINNIEVGTTTRYMSIYSAIYTTLPERYVLKTLLKEAFVLQIQCFST